MRIENLMYHLPRKMHRSIYTEVLHLFPGVRRLSDSQAAHQRNGVLYGAVSSHHRSCAFAG